MHLKELHSTCCLSRHFYFNINIISSKSSIFLDAYLLYNIESSTRFTSASWRCVKHFICHRKLISQIIYIFLRELLRPDQNKKLLFLRLSSVFNRNITTWHNSYFSYWWQISSLPGLCTIQYYKSKITL